MKKILRTFRDKIAFKEPPPPYEPNSIAENEVESPPVCEALDLLANCKITDDQDTPEYAEIQDMGLWHSTPLARRHKSKISLTWVLKENLENAKTPDNIRSENKSVINLDRRHKYVNDRYRKCKSQVSRVVGRNEYYHNMRFRSACEEFVNVQSSCSDSSEDYSRRSHKHRHKRKKKPRERFGYDIKDLDSFLTEASIDRPGNIPVVIAYPSTLYQTAAARESQREVPLPLGTVVNAVFKNDGWLYAQTPHGAEGYVLYAACLPLPILPKPTRTSTQKKTPCWESSTDIYPRPCGNLTDNEKEQLRGRTRSECRYRRAKKNCAEKDFDTLYLKTKSVSNIDKILDSDTYDSKSYSVKDIRTKRQTLLVVTSDYRGTNRSLSVQKGDVVVLVNKETDGEWFHVRKRDGTQGFIPASIAGNGYI